MRGTGLSMRGIGPSAQGRVSPPIDFEHLKSENEKNLRFFSFSRFEVLKIGKGMGFPGEPGRTDRGHGPISRSLDRFESIWIDSETSIFRRFEPGSVSTFFSKIEPRKPEYGTRQSEIGI